MLDSSPHRPPAPDPYNLQRFLDAQAGTYGDAHAEIHAGRKRSHWMWFIFPQLQGLGSSETAHYYAIKTRAEAEAYLVHPILGRRLRTCSKTLLQVQGRTALEIFGTPDHLKLHSSMTLFAEISGDGEPFVRVLQRYFEGQREAKTIALLAEADSNITDLKGAERKANPAGGALPSS